METQEATKNVEVQGGNDYVATVYPYRIRLGMRVLHVYPTTDRTDLTVEFLRMRPRDRVSWGGSRFCSLSDMSNVVDLGAY